MLSFERKCINPFAFEIWIDKVSLNMPSEGPAFSTTFDPILKTNNDTMNTYKLPAVQLVLMERIQLLLLHVPWLANSRNLL